MYFLNKNKMKKKYPKNISKNIIIMSDLKKNLNIKNFIEKHTNKKTYELSKILCTGIILNVQRY
jgi:hypothetical protein